MFKFSHLIYVVLGLAFVIFGMSAISGEYFYVGWGTGNQYVVQNPTTVYTVQNNDYYGYYAPVYPLVSYTTVGTYIPRTGYWMQTAPVVVAQPIVSYGYGYYGNNYPKPLATISYAYRYS